MSEARSAEPNEAGQFETLEHNQTQICGLAAREVLEDYYLACVSRAMDDREISLQKQGKQWFQISGAGHEALLLGIARSLRPSYDWFFPYYRDMALMLGLGITPYELLLHAVGSSADPSSAGRQMPSHWGHKEKNVVTQSSPTGSQCLAAVGSAEAARYAASRNLDIPKQYDEINYVSIGEGTTSEGEFWEALNSACVQKLNVLFVVADNGYAISVPREVQASAPISDLVSGFRNLEVLHIDGTDYAAVRTAAEGVIAGMRVDPHPALIHADVTRPYSHSAADTQAKYRTKEELDADARHDPLTVLRNMILSSGVCDEAQLDNISAQAFEDVATAAKRALAGPRPDPTSVMDQIVDLPYAPVPVEPTYLAAPDHPSQGLKNLMFGEAVRYVLQEAMVADERIRVFGEDVADARSNILNQVEGKGGVFGTTHGLQALFGSDRCFNTPLSEANIIGRAVGQAVRGLRPVPEIQFFDYIWPAMTQIRSEAATMRWRSNGKFTCPVIIRVPIGGYLAGGAIWHSQCGESIFAHIPGLLIAFPSRARDVIGLMRYAFRCEDPVLFLEHKHLLRQPYTADLVPAADYVIPFGHGVVRRPGTDMTIVTWGATVEKSLRAATELEHDGHQIEVFDLRTISPWDKEGIAESVRRTSRLLVVHEDTLTAGFGAEVVAWAAQELFEYLDAPPSRFAALDTHVPYEPTLENAVLPQIETITEAARKLLKF